MKFTAKILAAAAAAAMLCPLFALPAHAEGSIEDVYDAMRDIGLTDGNIQQFKNHYDSGDVLHDENGMTVGGKYLEYDLAAEYIEINSALITALLAQEAGINPEAVIKQIAEKMGFDAVAVIADIYKFLKPEESEKPVTTTESAPPVTDENGQTVSHTTVTTAESSAAKAVKDGSSGHSKEQADAFIHMTWEEKMAFLASLPEDERVTYMVELTPEERKSMMKQTDKDVLTEILNHFVDAGETVGMHISIDKIDTGQIDYSVRDSEGNLMDSSSFGHTIDDTGWDMTVPVLGSAGTILLSIGGLGWTAYRANKRREEVLHDEF